MRMEMGLSTFLQIIISIFALFGSAYLFAAQPAFAKDIVKTGIIAVKSTVRLIEGHDVLAISVFEEPDLSLSVTVVENGTISYPLIGKVEVKGLTTYEVEKKLEQHLLDGEFLVNPMVSVTIDITLMEKYHEKEIILIGEVRNPGPVTLLRKQITVLEAVAMAGGFTEFAAPNRTYVIRIEDGKEKKIIVNLNKVKKGEKSLDIILKAGDIIRVPEAYF